MSTGPKYVDVTELGNIKSGLEELAIALREAQQHAHAIRVEELLKMLRLSILDTALWDEIARRIITIEQKKSSLFGKTEDKIGRIAKSIRKIIEKIRIKKASIEVKEIVKFELDFSGEKILGYDEDADKDIEITPPSRTNSRAREGTTANN